MVFSTFPNDPFDIIINNLLDWDRKSYSFNRAEKDMNPYTEIHKDGKLILIHNVVGMDKKDIKILLKTENNRQYISIEGKTKDELTGEEYSINSRFALKSIKISTIVSELRNGLLYITISYDNKSESGTEKEIEIK